MRRLTLGVLVAAAVSACAARSSSTSPSAALLQPAPAPDRPSTRALHKGHVDVATGLYIRQDEDLIVPGPIPIVLTRTYRSGDRGSRHFGIGATHSSEWYLIGEPGQFASPQVILADGGRIPLNQVSSGASIRDAVFRHSTTPTHFYGSHLEWNDGAWALKFADGGLARFQSCEPGEPGANIPCSLVEFRDADGNSIEYVRDRAGMLTSLRSGERNISLEYDARQRIIRARDSSGQSVSYTYDDSGRLSRVVDSEGVVRSYGYGPNDEMLTIEEPGWLIENSFDNAGRVVRQATHLPGRRDPYIFTFAYRSVEGFSETDVTEDNGPVVRYRFDERRAMISETYNADGPDPISILYDPSGPFATAITVSCLGPNGPVVRTVPSTSTQPAVKDVKWLVIPRECQSGFRAVRYRD